MSLSVGPPSPGRSDLYLEGPTKTMVQDFAQAAREVSPIRRIVVPVEGADREFIVQEHAVTLAAALGVPVHALHIRSALDVAPDVFAWIEKEADQWGVDLESRSLDGDDAAAEILLELEPLDLVVIGSSRIGSKFKLGSVAEQLIRHAPCPVQVVRLPA